MTYTYTASLNPMVAIALAALASCCFAGAIVATIVSQRSLPRQTTPTDEQIRRAFDFYWLFLALLVTAALLAFAAMAVAYA